MTMNRESTTSKRVRLLRVVLVGAAAVAAAGVGERSAPPLAAQDTQIETRITSGSGGAQVRYAVPDFVPATPDLADAARTLGQVLWDDLDFEREFYMIRRDTYTSIPPVRGAAPIPFTSWRELGADALVHGTVQRVGDQLQVEYRLFNVATGREVGGKRYTGANARQIAHVISDEIFLRQRNLVGVAQTKLAFISDRNRESLIGTVEKREVKEVYTSDYDGAREQRITVNRSLNLNPSWSPDGLSLAYSSHIPRGGADIFVSRIYEGILQRPAKGVGNNYVPAISPDGKRIAFASWRNGKSDTDIYVVNVDGSNLRQLTTNPADDFTPTWSPSGAQIAFTSGRTGRPQIYMMNADGTGTATLVSRGETEADRPTWSRAPYNEIAFTARSGSWYDIKIYDVATGAIRQLTFNTETRGSNEGPAFSPTGRHLAFTSTRTGTQQIWIIGRDGRGEKQITRTGNNQMPSWSANPN